jgi:hypothetical protein
MQRSRPPILAATRQLTNLTVPDVGNEGSLEALRVALEELDCLVLLPPSILVELLRNPHSESGKRHVAAIVGIRGRRLASESQLCAEEFVRMVKRRRPARPRRRGSYTLAETDEPVPHAFERGQ